MVVRTMKKVTVTSSLLLCLLVYCEHVSAARGGVPGPPGGQFPPGRFGKPPNTGINDNFMRKFQRFTVNGRFDSDGLVAEIQRSRPGDQSPQEFESNHRRAQAAFVEADRAVQKDRDEQNTRSILGSSKGNEFLTNEATANQALEAEEKTRRLAEVTGIDVEQSFDAEGTPLSNQIAEVSSKTDTAQSCVFDKPNADPCESKFREPTGRCTNVEMGKKTWGMAGTPFTRVLPPRYEDGISEYRITQFSSKKPLTSPRKISETVSSTAVRLNFDGPSAFVMQWGQFIAHEFTLIGEIEKNVACCPDTVVRNEAEDDSLVPTRDQLEAARVKLSTLRNGICIPVENFNDTVFGEYVCMEHTRSKPSPTHDCSLGPRQQMNLITHVFDASNVYGSSQQESEDLRSFQGGQMKVQEVNGTTLPPPNRDQCSAKPANKCPFLGGDERINTTPNLIATHTMFLVLHNKIARQLAQINTQWNDEKLYQETRRIVSGIQANIHYREYIPLVVGKSIAQKFNIDSYKGFKSEVNPSILNELAGAAMRYGHSLIDGFVSLISDGGENAGQSLEPLFFNSDLIYDGGYRQCIRGLINDVPWRSDRFFTEPIRNNLFRQKRDLVSLNINRGRDHGFASYMDYRRHYGLKVARNWAQMASTHLQETIDALKQVYETVEDIELYIGGVTENPAPQALTGELFAHIIADGFARTRDGDRFYFENSEGSGLNQDQINNIKAFTVSKLFCEGADITSVPSKGFFTVSPSRPIVRCSSLPGLNLNLWKEAVVDNGGACTWEVVDMGKCCRDKRKIKRECKGESATCKCKGDAVIEEQCQCDPYDYRCQIENRICRFNKYTKDWNRFSRFTIKPIFTPATQSWRNLLSEIVDSPDFGKFSRFGKPGR